MIGYGQPGFPFTEGSIRANAPQQSGVYALYRPDGFVYVGESGNIQNRLLEHLWGVGDNPLILAAKPTGFCFELAPEWQRGPRELQLIAALNPVANRT
jgi:hypothetical protein